MEEKKEEREENVGEGREEVGEEEGSMLHTNCVKYTLLVSFQS